MVTRSGPGTADGERAAYGHVVLVLVATDFQQEIKDLRTTMTSVRDVTDLTALEATIADLEEQVAAPDLWDDQEKAQAVTSLLSRAKAE